jgi:hypothetical protein
VDRGDDQAAHVENVFRDANERIHERADELSPTERYELVEKVGRSAAVAREGDSRRR